MIGLFSAVVLRPVVYCSKAIWRNGPGHLKSLTGAGAILNQGKNTLDMCCFLCNLVTGDIFLENESAFAVSILLLYFLIQTYWGFFPFFCLFF